MMKRTINITLRDVEDWVRERDCPVNGDTRIDISCFDLRHHQIRIANIRISWYVRQRQKTGAYHTDDRGTNFILTCTPDLPGNIGQAEREICGCEFVNQPSRCMVDDLLYKAPILFLIIHAMWR